MTNLDNMAKQQSCSRGCEQARLAFLRLFERGGPQIREPALGRLSTGNFGLASPQVKITQPIIESIKPIIKITQASKIHATYNIGIDYKEWILKRRFQF